MKTIKNINDWTLTENDVQNDLHDNNYKMLEANMVAIKKQEKELIAECEELRNQLKEILLTAGINQSQFPVTPNRNVMTSDPMTPTLMCTPTNLNISKCHLINTLNDSAYHGDSLTSDGESDEGHSPMSTDTELSDLEDEPVFERQVEGCESDTSMQFSTSFIAGHVSNNRNIKKRSSGIPKGQGSNPLASSTMMEDTETAQRRRKPVSRGLSNPKASSTMMYNPNHERRVNKAFSPVVKLNDLNRLSVKCSNETGNVNQTNNINSIFTWSLQHSTNDVPLEESYLRSVKKRKPKTTERNMSKVNSRSSKNMTPQNQCPTDLPVEQGTDSEQNGKIDFTKYLIENPLYNKMSSVPNQRTNLQKKSEECETKEQVVMEPVFKKPELNSKTSSKVPVERKNSVVKKLLKFRESFKRKNGSTGLHTLATV